MAESEFDKWLNQGKAARKLPPSSAKQEPGDDFDQWLGVKPQAAPKSPPAPEIDQRGVVAEAGSALGAGMVSTMRAIAGTAEMVGIPGGERARTYWDDLAEHPALVRPKYLQEETVWEHPERLMDWRWWTRSLGENAPNMAAMMLPGLAAMKGAKLLGWGQKAIKAAAVAGAFGGAFVVEAGNAYTDAKQDMAQMGGFSEQQIEQIATAEGITVGIANGILEILPFDNLFLKSWGGDRIIKRIVQQALLEGSTEMAQEAVNIFVEKLGHKPDQKFKDQIGRILESGIIGAALGGGAGAIFKGDEEAEQPGRKRTEAEQTMTTTAEAGTTIAQEDAEKKKQAEIRKARKEKETKNGAQRILDNIIEEEEAAREAILEQQQGQQQPGPETGEEPTPGEVTPPPEIPPSQPPPEGAGSPPKYGLLDEQGRPYRSFVPGGLVEEGEIRNPLRPDRVYPPGTDLSKEKPPTGEKPGEVEGAREPGEEKAAPAIVAEVQTKMPAIGWDSRSGELEERWQEIQGIIDDHEASYGDELDQINKEIADLKGKRDAASKEKRKGLNERADRIKKEIGQARQKAEDLWIERLMAFEEEATEEARKRGVTDEDDLANLIEELQFAISDQRPYIERNYNTPFKDLFEELVADYTEQAPASFTERMAAAKDAEEGRAIIDDYEKAFQTIEEEAGLTPSVGQVKPTLYVGYSTLTAKEKKNALKAVSKADPELGEKLQALIDDIDQSESHWKKLLAEEQAKTELEYEDWKKKKGGEVLEEIEVVDEETGETVTLQRDAGAALKAVQAEIERYNALLECLKS